MGLFDKVKDAANAAKDSIKNAAETAKANYEQKKAEQEAYNAAMTEKAEQQSKEIIDAIHGYANEGSFFRNTSKEDLLRFTKEFYDKIFMPANSVSASKVSMHPYITDKQLEKFNKNVGVYNTSETALVYLRAENKKEFVLTDSALYFVLPLQDDPKFFAKGRVSCDQISNFTIEKGEGTFSFKCDEYVLSTLAADKSVTEDFITLNNYFNCVVNHDFEITDKEVDKLIREKIGEKVYSEVKKYMVYDDELMVYFAWGLDSLSAKDYIVCTDKQIIIMNREMMGATANVKQFYYEDITSASIDQNAQSNDLTVALIETALTAATKTCDLILSVAGAVNRINTLYKVEAERIVAVYHQCRKQAKAAAAAPAQVVVQQAVDPLEQLKKIVFPHPTVCEVIREGFFMI